MYEEDENIPWLEYNEYIISDLLTDDQLAQYFGVHGPGPPGSGPFLMPPPPPPLDIINVEECHMLYSSSASDTCSSFNQKVGDVPADSPYHGMNILSVIVAVCCVCILVSCITIFLLWKRRQKKSRLSHLQCRLSDSANFDYFPSGNRRMNKYYSDHSIRNQMEDSGVFYTGTMHPLYEEIPTPMSGGTTASHYAVSGEYQLLNSDYSTLPYSEATLPYSESIPFLQNNMISVRTNNQQNQRNSQNNGGGFYPKSNGHTKNTSKNGGKFSAQKTLPPIIKSGPFFGGGAKTCDITADDSMFQPPPGYHDSQWRSRGGWSTTANGGRMQTLDPVRHLSSNISSNTAAKKSDVFGRSESPRYQIPHTKPPLHPKNGTAAGNQNDFLPREAWTDFSGTNDWLRNAGLVSAASGETEQLLSVAGNGGKSRQQYEFSKNTLDCPGAVRASLRAGKDLSGWANDTPTQSRASVGVSSWADTRSSSGGESRDTTASAGSREISPTTLNSDVTISTTSSSDSSHHSHSSQPPCFAAGDPVKLFRTAADPLSGDPT